MSLKSTTEEHYKLAQRKQSFSSITCASDSPLEEQLFHQLLSPSPYELRIELFINDTVEGGLTPKLHHKSISWLITVCWSKDLSHQCLWYAVLLYYSLKSQKKIQKESLQLTLIGCLSLAIKMSQTMTITLKQLTSSCGKSSLIQNIIEMEANILESVDYNIVIPHYFSEIFNCGMSDEQIYPLLFICELLMIKNCQIFFDKEKIQKIAEMIEKQSVGRSEFQEDIIKEINGILVLKESKIVLNKYSPKFDTETFIMKFTS